jgi:hypothetical protein
MKNHKDHIKVLSDASISRFERIIVENIDRTKLYTLSEIIWGLNNITGKNSHELIIALFVQVMSD